MRSIIIGGGKVGGELAERLFQKGAAVVVVESDEERARVLSDRLPVLVVIGDGTDMRRLDELDLRPSDFFIAVTGVDEDNLAACQLAAAAYGIRRVLARMNSPRNRLAFQALGVPTVNVTDEMTAMIERDLEVIDRIQTSLPEEGELVTLEVVVADGFVAQRLRDVELPPGTVVVTLTRSDAVVVPDGDTRIEEGDKLMVVTHSDTAEQVTKSMTRVAGVDE